jgi:oxygen-independent coproporphyrinogen-3 oxidase
MIQKDDSMFVFDFNFPIYNWFYPLSYSEINVNNSGVLKNKLADIYNIAGREPQNRSLYFHIPFCQDICAFCPFTREVLKSEEYLDRYVDALIHEIEIKSKYSNIVKYPITSIFFGGGTPSILLPRHIIKIGKKIREVFDLSALIEFSFEMNAKTVTIERVEALKSIGVTHARMGVQTFNPSYREMFHLSATIEQIKDGAKLLNDNFKFVCVDMLYGMHGQTVDDFLRDLHHVIQLDTTNIDVYPINNSVIQKRLKNEYMSKNLKPASGLTKFAYNVVLNQYMRENGYLPHNGHGYFKSNKEDILLNPVVTNSYTFQYHETNYGYKGHEIIAFGVAGYSVFDDFVVGNIGDIGKYITMLLDENELPIAGVGEYPPWMTDLKGIILHLPYHGYAEKSKLKDVKIDEETLKKLEILKKLNLITEDECEYRLTHNGWNNYVNLLYYLSPSNEQKVLDKFIEDRYPEDPWKINLEFSNKE